MAEHASERRSASTDRSQQRRPAAGRAPQGGLPGLQRAAGNAAVASMVEQLRAADTSAEGVPLLSPAAPAERQADALAAKVTGQAPAGATRGPQRTVEHGVAAKLDRPGGRPLDPSTAASLRGEVGPRVSGIRVHDDATSHAANAAIGARAVTRGSTIHLGAGEASAPDVASLLAHEAAHAVQDNGGAIAAKLKGTAAAVTAMGGTVKKRGRSEYKKIITDLEAYEKLEDDAVALQQQVGHGYTSMDGMLAARLDEMQALLDQLDKKVTKWLGSKEAGKAGKSARADALRLALPRIRLERRDIAAGHFAETKGYDDSKVTASEKGEAGQVNETSKVSFGKEDTYFKADEARDQLSDDGERAIAQHEDLGFDVVDPRLGSRSVAMYRLDQLLGGGLIARTEFGTFGSKMGIVMEKAKGRTIPDHDRAGKLALTEGDAEDGQFSLEDATLQRCLARLQVIDAIAGQLDRHAGNYFVQTDDSGKVIGVTGIDNDMAFGRNMTDADADGKATRNAFGNYQGMPQVLDAEFAARVLDPNLPALVEEALAPLLTPAELAATISRLADVAEVVRALQDKGNIVEDYSLETAAESRTEKYGKRSIAGREQQGELGELQRKAMRAKEWDGLSFRGNDLWKIVVGYFTRGEVASGKELLELAVAAGGKLTAADKDKRGDELDEAMRAAAAKAYKELSSRWRKRKDVDTGPAASTRPRAATR